MAESEWHDREFSLFALGTSLLQQRWRLARWALLGGVVAALAVVSRPSLFLASASFVPQGADASRSGLAGLAGRFGVAMPTGNESQSPEFYARLLESRVLLAPITRDTFVVSEKGETRISFLDLFAIEGGSPKRREDAGVSLLRALITTSVAKTTGIVEVSVATQWPSVSLAIANKLVNGVSDFNQRTRQGQATAERKFVEERLLVAAAELRDAEDRLERFLMTNRQFGGSAELTFQRERLQRAVAVRQEVFTSLTQSYEEVRIREVRDTPVITVIEAPSVPTLPEPRGRLTAVLVGALLGGFFGTMVAFMSATMARRRKQGDPEADEFVATLGQVKRDLLRGFRRFPELFRR